MHSRSGATADQVLQCTQRTEHLLKALREFPVEALSELRRLVQDSKATTLEGLVKEEQQKQQAGKRKSHTPASAATQPKRLRHAPAVAPRTRPAREDTALSMAHASPSTRSDGSARRPVQFEDVSFFIADINSQPDVGQRRLQTDPEPAGTIYEETIVDMGRIRIRIGDQKGTEEIYMDHLVEPDPAKDDEFPLRDPKNPNHVLACLADEKFPERCAGNVQVAQVTIAHGMKKQLGAICKQQGLALKANEIQQVLCAIESDTRAELQRLVRGDKRSSPWLCVRKLTAQETLSHEKDLIGKHGVFASARPGHRADRFTLLGIFGGELLATRKREYGDFNRDRPSRPAYDMTLSSQYVQAPRGFANSTYFVNTSFKAGTNPTEKLVYDTDRINAVFVPFNAVFDRGSQKTHWPVMALIGFPCLHDKQKTPHGEVRADYGPQYVFPKPPEPVIKIEPGLSHDNSST